MATLEGVDSRLATRIRWVMSEAEKTRKGSSFWITTGRRSLEDQWDLWNTWQAGIHRYGSADKASAHGVATAAYPGSSMHGKDPALAVDLACDSIDNSLRRQLFKQASLITPVVNSKGVVIEEWHAQLAPILLALPALVIPAAIKIQEVTNMYGNPAVSIQTTSTGKGYWMLLRDGAVITFGDAPFLGGRGGSDIENAPFVGMSSTPDDKGYVLLGEDGGVFPFGSVQFYGSAVENVK